MNRKLMLTTLCVLGIPAAAAGDFYAGVGGGAYRYESGEFKDTAPSFDLMGGYSFNQHFAIEGTYLRMFDAEDSIGGSKVKLYGDVYELSTTLSYPFADRFQGYGRLGWSYYDATLEFDGIGGRVKENDYDDDFSWALGGKFDVTDRIGIRGEYGRLAVDGADPEFLSLGMTYGFGIKQ